MVSNPLFLISSFPMLSITASFHASFIATDLRKALAASSLSLKFRIIVNLL